MLLDSLFPNLPTSLPVILTYISGMLGTILLVYSVFVEAEYRSDIMRCIGALGLIIYTVFIGNLFLTITFAAFGIASLIEAIEIRAGLHPRHGEK